MFTAPALTHHTFVVEFWDGNGETEIETVRVEARFRDAEGRLYPGLIGEGEREEAAAMAGYTAGLGFIVSEYGVLSQRQPWGGTPTVGKVWTHQAWMTEQRAREAEADGAEVDETLGSCGCTDYHMADCPLRG